MSGSEWIDALLGHMPWWFYLFASVIILLTLAIGAFLTLRSLYLGAKRLADTLERESKIIQLQDALERANGESRKNSAIASQLATAAINTRAHVALLQQLREQAPVETRIERAQDLIQRAIESLASDVKHRSGEQHRCGLWYELDGELVLTYASSGFPPDYLSGVRRRLKVHASLAGKAFRQEQSRQWDDVRVDDDWTPNPNSRSRYTALVCIPIRLGSTVWGVLTIDALAPMTDEDRLIGELYAAVIENALWELIQALAAQADEVAAAAQFGGDSGVTQK